MSGLELTVLRIRIWMGKCGKDCGLCAIRDTRFLLLYCTVLYYTFLRVGRRMRVPKRRIRWL